MATTYDRERFIGCLHKLKDANKVKQEELVFVLKELYGHDDAIIDYCREFPFGISGLRILENPLPLVVANWVASHQQDLTQYDQEQLLLILLSPTITMLLINKIRHNGHHISWDK